MKKLTDVYIKVSTRNREALIELLNMPHLRVGLYIAFSADSKENANIWETLPNHKQSVNLRDLKRLVESIPTREEIKRLKAQVSAYKLNLKACKESLAEAEKYNLRLSKSEDSLLDKTIILRRDLSIKENEIEELKNDYTHERAKNDIQGDIISVKNEHLDNLEKQLRALVFWCVLFFSAFILALFL